MIRKFIMYKTNLYKCPLKAAIFDIDRFTHSTNAFDQVIDRISTN